MIPPGMRHEVGHEAFSENESSGHPPSLAGTKRTFINPIPSQLLIHGLLNLRSNVTTTTLGSAERSPGDRAAT